MVNTCWRTIYSKLLLRHQTEKPLKKFEILPLIKFLKFTQTFLDLKLNCPNLIIKSDKNHDLPVSACMCNPTEKPLELVKMLELDLKKSISTLNYKIPEMDLDFLELPPPPSSKINNTKFGC